MTKITMDLKDLKDLLDKQIELTTEKLRGESYLYNKETTDGHSKSLPIDEEKMIDVARGTRYPNEYEILKKFL